jgi:phosphopantetheinyl transferase
MPLAKSIIVPDATVAVWKTEETADFFLSSFHAETLSLFQLNNISNASKQLELLSSRYLLQTLIGAEQMLQFRKAESGMPYLENSQRHISLSHTKEHSAVMICDAGVCGIDIETVHPRVQKVAHKFMNDSEKGLLKSDDDFETMMLLWSAKETIYKLYGNKKVDFKEHLLLSDLNFTTPQTGTLKGTLRKDEFQLELKIMFEFFEGQVLTYASNHKLPADFRR